ncbi:four-carbon acid sugar kinase family protein [Edaphobacillus lindanitolerans]|uniref:Uncharacterized conserved protein YgbK, DUF1537 family n=1 Tax=Edaphobacillus lindanitolerans TaxID=550447 RepID=A0A1U7PHB3_9BACI|nr:four-carbon acid sugar kinase family protein [Edaphobacillus lindanitolerans]SIT66055.1 Uncharacterized conserved protein YgbK, DUF1537 family [Edaphobacillus lindanitolerans]
MRNKFGIIADDLTGANDSGVQLAKKGLRSTVLLKEDTEAREILADAVILDTDSRSAAPGTASDKVGRAARLLKEMGVTHFYKKLDSTMRGNVSEELAAMEAVCKPDILVIAPAFPKLNRTTRDGNHYVNGKLITDTEFAKDPKTPVTEGHLPSLFEKVARGRVVLLPLEQVRQGTGHIADFAEAAACKGQTWIVCDAETDEDLKLIAEGFAMTNANIVWAGSGGLAEPLPDALKLTSGHRPASQKPAAEKVLVVSGSLSDATRLQLEELRSQADIHMIEADPAKFVRRKDFKADMDCPPGKHIVLFVGSGEDQRKSALQAGEALGLDKQQIGERIAEGLGRTAQELIRNHPETDALILTGGDTAKTVCNRLGLDRMQLIDEVEPGLPFGRLRGAEGDYWAVTKAGGFGNPSSLAHALRLVTGKDE